MIKSLKKQSYRINISRVNCLVGGEIMTNVGEMYVCKICGNAVEVVAAGAGRLVCCGQPMELVEEDEQ
jgi:desulfoferrodoxin-like iron-binding protein